MSSLNIVPIAALGLASDGKIYIKKESNDIYLIDDHADIVVFENVNVSLLDKSNNKSIKIESKANSVIKYTVLDSYNSKRQFNINGELDITQITLIKTKEELNVSLNSEHAMCNIKCLCISSDMKNTFKQYISHNSKSTTSNITNVAVAMHGSNVVFDTTGKVEKQMSLSKCQQLSRGIVMDDISAITAKPILLIDEYDCFANHGATIGKMSDEDLFYLMSRGLSKKEAFLLILQGIIQPFISSIEVDEWKNNLQEEISNLIEK